VEAGFHSTTLPISAGAVGRLAPMAVKLNGVTANTNPSSGRCSARFHWPGAEMGCSPWSRSANQGLNRQKSITSQAESISACCAVLPWPSMVAALSTWRHGPASSSAALRNTAARSWNGSRDHSRRASRAAVTAWLTSSGPAWW
jgi:hypothetical protein